MATGIQNAIIIEIDATAAASATYTLPRDGRVVDILIQDIAGVAGNVTATLDGAGLTNAAIALAAAAGGLSRAASIVDAAADGVAGDVLSVASAGGARFKAFVTFLTPVVV